MIALNKFEGTVKRNACEVLGVTEYYGAIYYNYNGRRFAPFI